MFLQIKDNWTTFYLLRQDKKLVLARIHFHISNSIARSPFRNPFGSYEFSETIEPRHLYEFMEGVNQSLEERGVRMIEIIHHPFVYKPIETSLTTSFLINQGFQIVKADLSACLEVGMQSFETGLTSWEKRKLGMCRKAQLRNTQLPLSKLSDLFQFIHDCREERGQSLSLNYGQLKSIVDTFPERFFLFATFSEEEMVAGAIVIEVGNSIMYNFYSAHSRKADAISPIVSLMEEVYTFCNRNKVRLLDLGTSMQEGKPNFSLLEFKMHLGAKPSPKFTLTRQLT